MVFNLISGSKRTKVNKDVKQMATMEIEEEITKLEEEYAKALDRHAVVHSLSVIWRRIKELKAEVKERNQRSS